MVTLNEAGGGLTTDSQPKSAGLVWVSATIWCLVHIHQMNQVALPCDSFCYVTTH